MRRLLALPTLALLAAVLAPPASADAAMNRLSRRFRCRDARSFRLRN